MRFVIAFLLLVSPSLAWGEGELKSYTYAAPASKLTVVHAGAVWCAPCMKMRSQWEAFAQKYRGKVQVVHVNVDQQNTPEYKLYGDKITAAGGLPLTMWLNRKGSLLRSDQRTLSSSELGDLTSKELKKLK